jgi:hypothetical protein
MPIKLAPADCFLAGMGNQHGGAANFSKEAGSQDF